MKTDFKVALEQYFSKEVNRRYSLPIIQNLTQQHMHGDIRELKTDPDNILKICNKLIQDSLSDKRYTASVVPTIISPQMARNFYLKDEKEPSENELYEFLYLILTGVYKGPYIVNITNTRSQLIDNFRQDLIDKQNIVFDSKKAKEPLGMKLAVFNTLFANERFRPPMTEFTFPFLVVSSFVYWIKERTTDRAELIAQLTQTGQKDLIENDLEINDDTTLVLFVLGRDKKKVYYFSQLRRLIIRWFKGYLQNEENYPSVVNALFSLYISNKNYRDLSIDLLDKLLYYFLDGYVNGELLDKLMLLKLDHDLKQKKVFGMNSAKQFFENLSSSS
ncbi:hypothetical protein Ngar_c03830 [Candidatus Nitrososphaera gargensis Ga9.2]|uniref:Uncharacterized protein n=1 Tax=Nitrososphaera gargensis (strain Ga9.2) TaxID=1237085 RepID=K0I7T9_NITGG|nr:hypothetical protein [Candidatus Nitrososphaera gargensis]AFU57331.1 hypothetical protein Ngar_c03830 [Candidatus Nitrososphaera gargensis Ga9.2]